MNIKQHGGRDCGWTVWGCLPGYINMYRWQVSRKNVEYFYKISKCKNIKYLPGISLVDSVIFLLPRLPIGVLLYMLHYTVGVKVQDILKPSIFFQCFKSLASSARTSVTKDATLYYHDRRRFFRLVGLASAGQFVFWVYLAYFQYSKEKLFQHISKRNEDLSFELRRYFRFKASYF